MRYGERYLKVNEFIRYCKEVNIEVDKKELEYYESRGIMLPTARVVLPEEYILQKHTSSDGEETPSRDWLDIDRLYDRPLYVDADYATLTDNELMDSFDRAFGQSDYLIRPQVGDYQPWKSYETRIVNALWQQVSRAKHYYSYWQVHQLSLIQKFPNLYRNRWLIKYLPQEEREKARRAYPLNEEFFRTFRGNALFYDALSCFVTMHYRELRRTFATIPERHQIRRLTEAEHQDLLKRLAQHAHAVVARYGLVEADLIGFLSYLVNLHREYEKAERSKLDRELRKDIFSQAQLITHVTGKEWEAIGEALAINTPLGTRSAFLALDEWTKTKRRAGMTLEWAVDEHSKNLVASGISTPTYMFSDSDAEEIIRFCVDADLTLLIETLAELTAVGEEEREAKFGRDAKYQSVRNLTTAFEYLMKEIDEKGPRLLSVRPGRFPGFLTIVKTMMQKETSWIAVFSASEHLTRGGTVSVFEANLATLRTGFHVHSSEPHFVARCFLIACLARNVSIHFFPHEDWFYGELFSEMSQATVYALLYTWRIAKKSGWV
jgi:hypothetical protein